MLIAARLVSRRLLPARHHAGTQDWPRRHFPGVPRHCTALAVLQQKPRQVVADRRRIGGSKHTSECGGGREALHEAVGGDQEEWNNKRVVMIFIDCGDLSRSSCVTVRILCLSDLLQKAIRGTSCQAPNAIAFDDPVAQTLCVRGSHPAMKPVSVRPDILDLGLIGRTSETPSLGCRVGRPVAL